MRVLFSFWLLAALLPLATPAMAAETVAPDWNRPEVAALDLRFLTVVEIAGSRAAAPGDVADARDWISKMLKPVALPKGWESHLIFRGEPGKGVFFVNYLIPGYRVLVRDSLVDTQVGFVPLEARGKVDPKQHLSYVLSLARRYLRVLPNDPPVIFDKRTEGITEGMWSPDKFIRKAGSKSVSVPAPHWRDRYLMGVFFRTDGYTVTCKAQKSTSGTQVFPRRTPPGETPPP